MSTVWTQDEIALLKKGMSNEEIAEITGRTVAAVRMKRSRLSKEERDRADYAVIDKKTRINHILTMAKRLGVRLLGK